MEDKEGVVVEPLRRKSEKKEKKVGISVSTKVIIAASIIERLSAQVVEKKKKVQESIHCLKKNAQLLLLANKLDKELREEEIKQGGL